MANRLESLKGRAVWAGAFPVAVLIYCALVISAAVPKRRSASAGSRNAWGLPQPVDLA
jgi:hypothetical protein